MNVMRRMSGKGDELVAEWDPATVSEERLLEIEKEFKDWQGKGGFAGNLDNEELIETFDPNANILLIPKIQGG